jgi:hypothetical protein
MTTNPEYNDSVETLLKRIITVLKEGGGGGDVETYVGGSVQYYENLPVTVGTPELGEVYIVRESSGIWLINRKSAGLWYRSGNDGALTDWTFLGTFPDSFSDANFALYNDTDPSKQVKVDLSNISEATTRTISFPDKDGEVLVTPVIPSDIGAEVETIRYTLNEINNDSIDALYQIPDGQKTFNKVSIGPLDPEYTTITILTPQNPEVGDIFTIQVNSIYGGDKFSLEDPLPTGGPYTVELLDVANQVTYIYETPEALNVTGWKLYTEKVDKHGLSHGEFGGDRIVISPSQISNVGASNNSILIYNSSSNQYSPNSISVLLTSAPPIGNTSPNTATFTVLNVTQQAGFYGKTPINQPNTVSDAVTQDLTGSDTIDRTKVEADLTSCKNAINAVIDRLQDLGLIA